MWLNRKIYALLARVIALLGFVSVSSCEQPEMYGPPPCMYGPEPERTNYGCRLDASVTDELSGVVLAEDIDGAENGGEFEPVELEFSNEGSEIQSNAYQKSLQIVMKRKE